MKLDHAKLKGKGWSDEEIEQAKQILLQAEQNKHPKLIKLEKALYWIVLAIIFLGGIGVAWLMEPIMLATKPLQAGIVIFILGLLFGTLSSMLIKDIEALELHHHILISASIPTAAVIASIFITKRVALLRGLPEFTITHHPILLGGVFALGALLPYIILTSLERR